MATTYAEFTTTPANLVADLRSAILVSADWTRPNAAGQPNLVSCTTTRGVQMAVDLSDVSPTTLVATFAVYRSHDGTTGVDKAQKKLHYKRANTGTINDLSLSVVVSAGKEHLYLSVEGPRPGQANADSSSYGSLRGAFFVSDLIPYFPIEDTTPVAVCGSLHNTAIYDPASDALVYTYSAVQGYRIARLATLNPATWTYAPINRNGLDGDLYLSPFVVCEDTGGMRGRLNKVFCGGYNFYDSTEAPIVAANQRVVYDTEAFRVVTPYKSDGTNVLNVGGPFGYMSNALNTANSRSVQIAVPTT